MAKKTVKILLEVTVRDFTKAEREAEDLDKENCAGAAKAFTGDDLAELLPFHIESMQDEILAGSNAMVKIVSVDASSH